MFSGKHNVLFRHVALTLAVVASLNTSISRGTVLRKLSLDELVSHADTIAVGTCEKTEAIWLDRKIYTVATIRVGRPIKGETVADNIIRVYILGGRVRKPMPVKMNVPGAAQVMQGEEMLLFLKSRCSKGQHRFVGMAQGKIPVKTDFQTSEKVIRRADPVKGVELVDKQGKSLPSSAMLPSTKEDSLESLLENLGQIIAEQEASNKDAARQDETHRD